MPQRPEPSQHLYCSSEVSLDCPFHEYGWLGLPGRPVISLVECLLEAASQKLQDPSRSGLSPSEYIHLALKVCKVRWKCEFLLFIFKREDGETVNLPTPYQRCHVFVYECTGWRERGMGVEGRMSSFWMSGSTASVSDDSISAVSAALWVTVVDLLAVGAPHLTCMCMCNNSGKRGEEHGGSKSQWRVVKAVSAMRDWTDDSCHPYVLWLTSFSDKEYWWRPNRRHKLHFFRQIRFWPFL